jgi:hypothetical protein
MDTGVHPGAGWEATGLPGARSLQRPRTTATDERG